jgi:transcription initiation factor IIE alpha subunit
MSPDWRLMRRIVFLVAANGGLADMDIAEKTGVPVADVRQAARVLYRQRKVDFCAGYVVAVPRPAEGRRAA